MTTLENPVVAPIAAQDMAELEKAVERLIRGVRDPAAMDRAANEMDDEREEIRQRLGGLDLAVPLTRETRDE